MSKQIVQDGTNPRYPSGLSITPKRWRLDVERFDGFSLGFVIAFNRYNPAAFGPGAMVHKWTDILLAVDVGYAMISLGRHREKFV